MTNIHFDVEQRSCHFDSDSIPSYGHTCSFVAGVDAKHIRFGFIADEIQQAPQ